MSMTDKETDAQLVEVLRRLKGARLTARKAQLDCAYEIGVHRPSYTLIESGKQRLTVWQAIKLSSFLRVPLNWLLADDVHQVEGKPWCPAWWPRYVERLDDEERARQADLDARRAFDSLRKSFKR